MPHGDPDGLTKPIKLAMGGNNGKLDWPCCWMLYIQRAMLVHTAASHCCIILCFILFYASALNLAVVGPWSLHVVDVGPVRKRSPARLDYLAMPAREGKHDFRLSVRGCSTVYQFDCSVCEIAFKPAMFYLAVPVQVRDLMMSIMYEQIER